MAFHSILFRGDEDAGKNRILNAREPDFFRDLNLDQVKDTVLSGKEEYDLAPFFYTPLNDPDDILYRQEVMQDLEDRKLSGYIEKFAGNMRSFRKHRTQTEGLYYKYHKERLFLDGVIMYCESLELLAHNLSRVKFKSKGFPEFYKYLANYVLSIGFRLLFAEAKDIMKELSTVKYCVHIKGLRVQVYEYAEQPNYSDDINSIFAKFKQGSVKDYRAGFPQSMGMNQVEAKILEGVAQLYPGIFSHLDNFYVGNKDFPDKIIEKFEREIQFYVAWLQHIRMLEKKGLKFCYPQVSNTSKEVLSHEGFDIALAHKHSQPKIPVVANDFYLKDNERVLVVSGPNQGGKTTFARTFGQLHYLASLGCPVPGSKAKLFLSDRLFTHFEKEEDIRNLRSKLEDDLVRIREILSGATQDSIIIMNEIFSSTTFQDAVYLGKKIMEEITRLGLLCVWVSFIDDLASFSEQTVSMTGIVDPENPELRTYKIIRKPADGLAYALSIAEKYDLTYDRLMKRIRI